MWVSKCWCNCSSMCSCVLGCMPACWTPFGSHERFPFRCQPTCKPAPNGKHVQLFKTRRKVGNGSCQSGGGGAVGGMSHRGLGAVNFERENSCFKLAVKFATRNPGFRKISHTLLAADTVDSAGGSVQDLYTVKV